MYKLIINKNKTLDGEELLWNNTEIISKLNNYLLASTVCTTYLRMYPEKNLVDYQEELIKRDLDIYIIASEYDSQEHKLFFPNFNKNIKLNYKSLFICSSSEAFQKEVLKHSTSFEENSKKLLETGFIVNINEDIDDLLKNWDKIDSNESEDNKLLWGIKNNKIQLDLIVSTAEKELKDQLKLVRDKYNIEPKKILIAEGKDGEKIYAYEIEIEGEKTLASSFGVLEKSISDKKIEKIINIYDNSTWVINENDIVLTDSTENVEI